MLSLCNVMESLRCVSRIARRFSIPPCSLIHPASSLNAFSLFLLFRSSPLCSVRGQPALDVVRHRKGAKGEREKETNTTTTTTTTTKKKKKKKTKTKTTKERSFCIPGTLVRIWICIDWLVIASYFTGRIVPGYLLSNWTLFKRGNEVFSGPWKFIWQIPLTATFGPTIYLAPGIRHDEAPEIFLSSPFLLRLAHWTFFFCG